MQIKQLKVKNYKTYLDLELDLSVDERPIILIGGMNGGGKTTLFEAICGALYGLNIKTEKQFNELQNNGSFGKVEPKIELEIKFTGQVLNTEQTYLLRRTYQLSPSNKPVETVHLNMGGTIFHYGTQTAPAQRLDNERQVNKIIKANLPQELSQYFLFDAMQSSKLLEEGVFSQLIRDNIENVMGFNKYIQLRKASEKLTQDKAKERLQAEEERQEYEGYCKEKEELEKQLKDNEQKQDILLKYAASMKQAYEDAKSGADAQEHIKQQLQGIDSTIDETEKSAGKYSDDLKMFVEDIESNVFVAKLVNSLAPEINLILRRKAELKKENQDNYDEAELKEITSLVVDYLKDQDLCSSTVNPETIVKYIISTQATPQSEDEYAYLDENDVKAFEGLVNQNFSNGFVALDERRTRINLQLKDLKRLRIQRDDLQRSLSDGNLNLIQEYETKQNELTQLVDENRDLRGRIDSLTQKIHTFDIQIQQEPDVTYDTLMKLTPFFQDVADTLLKSKKTQIETEMKEQLNELLLSYKNCIDRVELADRLDSEFTIKLFHKAGNEISLGQLNAASKQIFIQVLLKVLRNLGDYNPPVMIDTVMGVIDEESRAALMENYFPQLAEQTILLCTTSEIRKDSDYKKLEAFIAKTYTLTRNAEEQCTTVESGYFGVQLSND